MDDHFLKGRIYNHTWIYLYGLLYYKLNFCTKKLEKKTVTPQIRHLQKLRKKVILVDNG